jgi:CPA2 family monovalent cation:H+ antiporter-2
LFSFFKFTPWVIVVLALSIIVFIYYVKKYFNTYQKIQSKFIFNLNHQDEIEKKNQPLRNSIKTHLSNRDIHFAEVTVSADSPFIGRTIDELNLRKNYGINIVQIVRGSRRIYFPSSNEFVYPSDQLLAIGTDKQISDFTNIMEMQEQLHDAQFDKANQPDISLSSFIVGKDSYILGKHIANSGIRNMGCMIVGIDRNGVSIMNPDVSFVFEEGDLVWIVGEKNKILTIVESLEE